MRKMKCGRNWRAELKVTTEEQRAQRKRDAFLMSLT